MDALLARLSDSIVQAQNQEDLVRPLLEMLGEVTQLESTYLTSIDFAQAMQHVLYARNTQRMHIPEGFSVPWDDSLCQRALKDGLLCTNNVPAAWPDAHAAHALGIRTYVSAPVYLSDGRMYGTLCAASEKNTLLPEGTNTVLRMFAKLIAQRIEHEQMLRDLQKLNTELSHLALTDALTQLPNRAALLQELQRQLARAQREHSRVLIAFIDLDGFKRINDQYGHAAGDRLLCTLAERLRQSLRGGDMVARMGGDEFVLITTSPAQAGDPERALAALRTRLRNACICDIALPDGRRLHYPGASLGLVHVDGNAVLDEALQQADAAMYSDKLQRKSLLH